MKLEQRLELRLAPVLLQRLDLLTLPLFELQQLIKQELEQNPMLEKEDEEIEEELPLPEEIDDWDTYPKSTEYDPEQEKRLPMPAPKPTLKEYLISQLRVTIKNEKLIKIGEHIIYELNEDGYLPSTVEEIANFLNQDTKIVESVLKQIQQFDPPGVGARNLQECLLIQLQARKGIPKNALLIIKNFYKEFIAQDYKKIRSELNISEAEFEKAIQYIKACRPKPGKTWEGEIKYVLPEVVVDYDGEQLVTSLTDEWIPKIKLSKHYQELLLNPASLTKEEKDYLREKINSAKLLLEGIEKRRETIAAIADYIVRNEVDFLTYGNNYIKFITLEEVAQAIGRSPSTVSRAIKGKWIQTPNGAFSFKTFFSGGKTKEYAAIIYRIKELIQNENKSAPLKDQKIAELLEREGFKIARTTIIKYRTQLGIPNAIQRKVWNKR